MFTPIKSIDTWLKNNRSDYYDTLNPGASSEVLDEFERLHSITLPKAFRQLYRWRNGQSENCFMSIQNNQSFMSLESITKAKSILDDMLENEFDDPNWWKKEWFPFLDNGSGDHLCVEIDSQSLTNGRVFPFYHDWENRTTAHHSFQAWLKNLLSKMKNGKLELS